MNITKFTFKQLRNNKGRNGKKPVIIDLHENYSVELNGKKTVSYIIYLPSSLAEIKQFRLVKNRIANTRKDIVKWEKVADGCLIHVVSGLTSSRPEISYSFYY